MHVIEKFCRLGAYLHTRDWSVFGVAFNMATGGSRWLHWHNIRVHVCQCWHSSGCCLPGCESSFLREGVVIHWGEWAGWSCQCQRYFFTPPCKAISRHLQSLFFSLTTYIYVALCQHVSVCVFVCVWTCTAVIIHRRLEGWTNYVHLFCGTVVYSYQATTYNVCTMYVRCV